MDKPGVVPGCEGDLADVRVVPREPFQTGRAAVNFLPVGAGNAKRQVFCYIDEKRRTEQYLLNRSQTRCKSLWQPRYTSSRMSTSISAVTPEIEDCGEAER